MHLKVRRVRQNGRMYEYVEFVQSVRGANGKPTHEVLAKLGSLDPIAIENLRTALKANRHGKPVVMSEREQAPKFLPVRVRRNLAFLDVMAMQAMWNHWQLPTLFGRLLERDDDDVAPDHVALALTIHRAVEPGSKLSAVSWFPETCLPEFLRIEPEQFNNSRVHRILDALEGSLPALQKNLPLLYMERKGKPEALFLDVTDTYFEGRGCELAERSRTKEGLRNRRKIGITLLCDEKGIPLQWSVVPGKRDDKRCMSDLLDSIQDCYWVGTAPVVCDRAMGQASGVDHLLRSGLRFLTAVPRREMDAYGVSIPAEGFSELEADCDADPADVAQAHLSDAQEAFERDVQRVAKVASKSAMGRIEDSQFVIDLGTGTRPLADHEIPWLGEGDIDPTQHVGAACMIAWARIFARALEAGDVRNRAEVAKRTGVSRARITEVMRLLQLDEKLQDGLLAGEFGAIAERHIKEVVKHKSPKAQRRKLESLMAKQQAEPTVSLMKGIKLRVTHTEPLRCVAYFNPYMFVRQRLRSRKRHDRVIDFVAQLNDRLASPRCRLDEHRVRFEITERLARDHQIALYEVSVEEAETHGRVHLKVSVERDEKEWRRRRKYDGFVLLVGHHDLPHSAAQLAQLYRDKDAVERDFRLIKSNLELRPVYHRTDQKVRAHVALCMLALLLERALEARLAAAGIQTTADACLRALMPGQLNLYDHHELLDSVYSATRTTPRQRELLKALGLSKLTRDRDIAKQIRPRTTPPNA
jgi:hypothetical protein